MPISKLIVFISFRADISFPSGWGDGIIYMIELIPAFRLTLRHRIFMARGEALRAVLDLPFFLLDGNSEEKAGMSFDKDKNLGLSLISNEHLISFDDFSEHIPCGLLQGSYTKSGHQRLGKDVEKVMSIDNCALRIAPFVRSGFGREILSYGPFVVRPGLSFLIYILNGHNTAQAENLPDTFMQRLLRWVLGSETDSAKERLKRWVRSRRVKRTLKQFRWWWYCSRRKGSIPNLDENLSVGWFPRVNVEDPRLEGNSFIMHALGPENGQLWAGAASERTFALRGVQNIPLYLIAIIRPGGTIYYTSSVEGANGFPGYPRMRAVAIDRCPHGEQAFLGIHQSVLGQIGFRIDTRIYNMRIAHLREYAQWFGGAHAADRLVSRGALVDSSAEKGGGWELLAGDGGLIRGHNGAQARECKTEVVLTPDTQSGLIHAVVKGLKYGNWSVGLIWRRKNASNYWKIELSPRSCAIICRIDGYSEVIICNEDIKASEDEYHRLQLLDDGIHIMGFLDGMPIANSWVSDDRLSDEKRTGISISNNLERAVLIRDFEAHPKSIDIPPILDPGPPWQRNGKQIVGLDDFSGEQCMLEGRITRVGGMHWHRLLGSGTFEINGSGEAIVTADVDTPCPDRTAYCLNWPYHDFVDISVRIILPGTERGQKHRCTAGFILFQDYQNYLIINIWRGDSYAGGSISSFFCFEGFEDIYDAVWTNVGNRVFYGCASDLRLCCDGKRYLSYLDEEAVLYRAFTDIYPNAKRLKIRKVGLVANWEWGRDTGSRFQNFKALY